MSLCRSVSRSYGEPGALSILLVIRLVVHYPEAAKDLLQQNDPHQLMGNKAICDSSIQECIKE